MLRDIDALKVHTPDLGDGLFVEIVAPHPTVSNRTDRFFDMTSDGLTLLVMGYTGRKAIIPGDLSISSAADQRDARAESIGRTELAPRDGGCPM